MATGAIGGGSCTKGTFDTSSSQEIDLSGFVANGVGVRVFVTVTSGTAALCIGENSGGTGGWRVAANDTSVELGLFDPSENLKIIGLAGATSTGAYTIAPATK